VDEHFGGVVYYSRGLLVSCIKLGRLVLASVCGPDMSLLAGKLNPCVDEVVVHSGTKGRRRRARDRLSATDPVFVQCI
jgi:hypothetical protein